MKRVLTIMSFGILAGFATSAVADNEDEKGRRVFRTQLVGYSEVPSVSTPARGTFRAVVDETGMSFTYWLTYEGLAFDAAQSHIHFGQHHTNGGISVWLCQSSVNPAPATAGTVPVCAPRATATPITATITAANVIGPAGQGIAAGEFAELLAAMRTGAAYANVHSGTPANNTTTPPTPAVGFPGGEIRGQIH